MKYKKCRNDTITFCGDNCVSKDLDFCLKLKGELKNKVVEYNLQLHAQNVSGFDTWVVLNDLDCDKRIVNNIKNGKGNFEMKVFNGYIEKNKKIPQYLPFKCGMTHLIPFLKN